MTPHRYIEFATVPDHSDGGLDLLNPVSIDEQMVPL
jgi:hypothetical protein